LRSWALLKLELAKAVYRQSLEAEKKAKIKKEIKKEK
jgi:hypothetical protein